MDPLKYHEKNGVWQISSKMPLETNEDLALAYTPGVGEVCMHVKNNPEDAGRYTMRGNTIAVVTDGSAVLGLGNIGPTAALPVMEGKCLLLKKFGDVDAIPLAIDTQDVDEIIGFCVKLAPTVGAIMLEDISAPRCFEIEEKLQKMLDIPVYHDDQHGTAIVVLAGLKNALKIAKKDLENAKIVINGAGAAGIAISRLLTVAGAQNLALCDSRGVIHSSREDLNVQKSEFVCELGSEFCGETLADVLDGADVFVGISVAGALKPEFLEKMAVNPIVFGLANPVPEIMPDEALKIRGDVIYASGRGDLGWSQVNNVIAFPGMFRGALDSGAKKMTTEMKLAAADALAGLVDKNELSPKKILPGAMDERACGVVSREVAKFA